MNTLGSSFWGPSRVRVSKKASLTQLTTKPQGEKELTHELELSFG